MRKKILIFIFLFVLTVVLFKFTNSKLSDPFLGFNPTEVERAAVGAISIPNPNLDNGDGPYSEICSGSLVGYDNEGNGLFLTVRHCIWEDGDEDGNGAGFIPSEFVSFRDNLKGPYYQTEVALISATDDLALLRVINLQSAVQPIIPEVLEDVDSTFLVSGDSVENVSFPLDMGKLKFYGSFVDWSFPHTSRRLQVFPQWGRTMPVDITIGHGSSGSPLFNSRTHKLVGVMVGTTGTTGEGRLMIAESLVVVVDFLSHPEKNTVKKWLSQFDSVEK